MIQDIELRFVERTERIQEGWYKEDRTVRVLQWRKLERSYEWVYTPDAGDVYEAVSKWTPWQDVPLITEEAQHG